MTFTDCIVTDRLILRRFVEEDVKDVFALMRDDFVARKAGFAPFKSLHQTEVFMKNWREGAYAITERGDNRVIGIVQLPFFPFDERAEIGYWLEEESRGKGYMTEAVEAVKGYAFKDWWWCNELRIHVYSENEASKRVALKCGFYPMYDAFQESVYSRYGAVESEECYSITRADYEWQQKGTSFYSTAAA